MSRLFQPPVEGAGEVSSLSPKLRRSSGDVEAPLVERLDGDLPDVVEAARGEDAVHDDQARPCGLLRRDRGDDPPPVGAHDHVVLELGG